MYILAVCLFIAFGGVYMDFLWIKKMSYFQVSKSEFQQKAAFTGPLFNGPRKIHCVPNYYASAKIKPKSGINYR